MGFDWDAHKSAGNFISAAEKKVLAENGIPFTITSIGRSQKFENEQFVLTIQVPNPETGEEEERAIGFPIGTGAESRDNMLRAMEAHFKEGGEPLTAKVVKYGRGFFLEQA